MYEEEYEPNRVKQVTIGIQAVLGLAPLVEQACLALANEPVNPAIIGVALGPLAAIGYTEVIQSTMGSLFLGPRESRRIMEDSTQGLPEATRDTLHNATVILRAISWSIFFSTVFGFAGSYLYG